MKILFESKGTDRIYYLENTTRIQLGRVPNLSTAPGHRDAPGKKENPAQKNFEKGLRAMARALGLGDLEIEEIEE